MTQLYTGVFRFLLFSALFAVNSHCIGQVNFKDNQVISIGGGEVLKVIRCKGEGAEQLCELAYYVNKKQVGKPFWLKSSGIGLHRKGSHSSMVIAKMKPVSPAKIKLREAGVVNSKTVIKKDNAQIQADMLAMARILAQQPGPRKSVKEKKEERPQKK